MAFDLDSHNLIFEQYSTLIKWIYFIINRKEDSKKSELEKQFIRRVNFFSIYYFDSRYIDLIPIQIINYIKTNNIKLVLINLKPQKTGVCYGFFLRLLGKYDKNLYSKNEENDDQFERDYLEIEILFDSKTKKFEPINFKDSQIGDVVIFEDGGNKTHIGYIYNENKDILSKLGDEHIIIEPLETQEYSYGFPKFYKYSDENFRQYFRTKIIPLIEKVSLNIELIEKILIEWGVDLNSELNTKDLTKLVNK